MDDKEKARFDRLPQWAQGRMRALEARVSLAEAKTAAAVEAANATLRASGARVWLNPYDRVPTPVTQAGEHVRFTLGDDGTADSREWVDVTVSRDHKSIEIQAATGIVIKPRASNTAIIELRTW